MTHLVFALRRLDPLTRIEFQEYWLQRHAPLVRSYAAALGITRYHQVHTVADDTTYGGAAFDGVAELWFGGQPTADALEAASELLADERTFIDLTSSPITVVDDRVVVDGPFDGMRMTTLLYKRADRSRDEFAAHWAGPHASLALRHGQTLGTNRYVQLYSTSDAATFPPALERGAHLRNPRVSVSPTSTPTRSTRQSSKTRCENCKTTRHSSLTPSARSPRSGVSRESSTEASADQPERSTSPRTNSLYRPLKVATGAVSLCSDDARVSLRIQMGNVKRLV